VNVDDVLARLDRVRRNGDGFSARCPSHEDREPSLCVTEGDGGAVLIKCHAGCETEAVVQAMGLAMRDLFPSAPKRDIVATYDYVDEQGNLLLQVLRFDPKGFAQRRPGDPGGPEWVWKLGDVRRVLYRLPEVLAEHDHVFVVEGEKDADALSAKGLTATTNVGGAGKWTSPR
jgi:hypothetical protein